MTHEALRTILPFAGWDGERARAVEFTGGTDPILPTPFRIGETAAAALARARPRRVGSVGAAHRPAARRRGRRAAGHRVAPQRALHEDGRRRPCRPIATRSWASTRRGTAAGAICTATSRIIATPRSACSACPTIARRCGAPWPKWDALELEEAIIAAKGAGGMVRTMAEWAQHPQAAAIASLPLMEIVKIGDSAPEKLPDGDRPLSGIRVLDLTRVLAGPTCARSLAEHGADVLKITGAHLPNIGYQEYDTGHGKLSAHLDLRAAARRRDAARARARDGRFSQGYRPGTLGDRGFSPEALAQIRPGIVFVSLCAFGHVGPWAARRGFDTVVQTVSGITARQGDLFPGAEPGPQFYPVSAIDYLTGYLMAFGAVVALGRRAREGGSWLVRISLAQTGRWLVGRGEVPEAALADVPKEFAADELARWSTTSETPVGRLTHLAPVVRMSETPPRWARPSVPLGYHEPVWPARSAA